VLEGSACDWDIDVYAYGILVYTTITKLVPYAGTDFASSSAALRSEVIRGTRPDLPDDLDLNWVGLIKRCWNGDPEVRPTWEWICQQLGGLSFVHGLTKPGVLKFKEYRKRVSPPDLVFSDARAAEKVSPSSSEPRPESLPRCSSELSAPQQFNGDLSSVRALITARQSKFHIVRLPSMLLARDVPLSRPTRRPSQMVKEFKSMPEAKMFGGTGPLKLVEDPGNHELIALKSIELKESSAGDRFVEELEGFIRLVHPCVLEIVGYSLETGDQTAIIGTKFAVGRSLKDAIESRRLDDTGIAIVVCGIVLGMQFIHSHDIVHQNLKPSDVLLDERGYARIGDAWLARLLDLDIVAGTSKSSRIYMSPEVYERKQGKPVDVYSFALILYELLVGRPVFDPEMALRILMTQVVSGVRPSLPESMNPAVCKIIERGWSVNPTIRPSFGEIWQRLERINYQLTERVDSSKVLEFISWVGTSGPDLIPLCGVAEHSYAFLSPQNGPEQFSLPFGDDATVGVVREEIASRLEVLRDKVQLLFGGRILRDSLVLVNLQIQDSDVIVIFIRELTQLRF
jgi:serine/threonine protein kinase